MRYAYATLRHGFVCLFLLPDTFQVDNGLERAGIFAREFGDAVVCEGNFKRASASSNHHRYRLHPVDR